MNLESFANLFAASLRRVEADQESEDEEEIDMSKSQVSCVAFFFSLTVRGVGISIQKKHVFFAELHYQII